MYAYLFINGMQLYTDWYELCLYTVSVQYIHYKAASN